MTEQLYPWGRGTPTWLLDDTANDSDKSFGPEAGKIWIVHMMHATLSATAVVGNRRFLLTLTDGTDTMYNGPTHSNQGASSTARYVHFPGAPSMLTGVHHTYPLPPWILPAGYVIRTYDVNAVDPAADDLTIALHYTEYDVS